MARQSRTVKASCLCGGAKHEITLPASNSHLTASLCNCDSCRHTAGTLCLAATTLPKQYEPSKELLARLKPYQFSKRLVNYHCPTCGTQMLASFRKNAENPESATSWDTMTGSLEQIDGVVSFQYHMHIADTLDGGFSDFLHSIKENPVERWPRGGEEEEQLPLHWPTPDEQKAVASTSEKLHAHCKCGGISFWIARPSARSSLGKAPWPDVLIPFNTPERRTDEQAWWVRESKDGSLRFLGGMCSCDSCRLACGMELVQWAFIPTIDISLDAEGKVPFSNDFGTIKAYRSSDNATRYHCDTCGAMVFWTGADRDGVIDVAVGLLDAPEGARAENWLLWRCNRLSYREDAIPRAKAFTLGVEEGMKSYGKRTGLIL